MLKICTKCGELKPLTEYYKASIRKDGYQSACKCCANLASKRSKEENTDQHKVYARRTRMSCKDRLYNWKGKIGLKAG